MKRAAALLLSFCAAVPATAQAVKVLPTARARILKASSADAAEAMGAILEELGFRLRVRQPQDGLFVTKATAPGGLEKQGLTVPPVSGIAPSEVEVHAFVSRALEPAHVHVDAIVTSAPRHDGTVAHVYSMGMVEGQILDALEKRLAVQGVPMPDEMEKRRGVASSLTGPIDCTVGTAHLPEVIQDSKMKPIFPAAPLRGGDSGRVLVLARILSDGSTIPIRVLSGTGTRNSKDMETISLATVALWRYRPARNGTCPIDVPLTVAVDFNR